MAQQQRPRPRPRPQEEEPIGLEPQILSNKEQKEVLEHIRTFRCTDLRTYLYISSVNSPNKEELLIAALQRYMSGGSIPYWEAHDSRQRHRSLARLYLESRVKKLPDITRKMKAWTDNRSGQDDLYLSPADRAALNIYLEIAEIARELGHCVSATMRSSCGSHSSEIWFGKWWMWTRIHKTGEEWVLLYSR